MIVDLYIIVGVVLYVLVFCLMGFHYTNKEYNGNELAGNAFAKGMTFFYGLAFLLAVAIVFTFICSFFFSSINSIWVKFLFFVPIILPVTVLLATIFNIKRPRLIPLKKQSHKLTLEIRAKEKLTNPKLRFKTLKGTGYLKQIEKVNKIDAYYIYTVNTAIYYSRKRSFTLVYKDVNVITKGLNIPYRPIPVHYSNWEMLSQKENKDIQKELYFRFTVSKWNASKPA